MDQSRTLEEGLAQSEAESDFSPSPTNVFRDSDQPEISEKSRNLSNGVVEERVSNQLSGLGGWSNRLFSFTTSSLLTSRLNGSESDVRVRSLDTYPEGYPNLAAFSDSDESYMIYRRFGYLQARLILFKQDEMRLLEEKLDAIDLQDHEAGITEALTVRLSDEGRSVERRELLKTIEAKYLEYANLLNTAQQLVALNKPGSGEYESVLNYVNGIFPVHRNERSYFKHKEDLISLRPGREHAWLDTTIEKGLKTFRCRFSDYLFSDEITKQKTDQPEFAYYSRKRIEACAVSLITAMILALLIVPIWLLYHLVSTNTVDGSLDNRVNAICIGILLVFTLAFSAMLSIMTRAQRHETLAASAGYCAVLVVFLGNVGNNN